MSYDQKYNLKGDQELNTQDLELEDTTPLKDTSHLKIVRLIMFMRNYGHEQFNSWTSWVIGNSPMIRNVISNGLETQYLRLRT